MNNTNLEIERRFILRSAPEAQPQRRLEIFQKYAADGWRYRMQQDGDSVVYYKTRKTSLAKGVNHEEEYTITEAEYNDGCGDVVKGIAKTRLVHHHNGLDFEVDVFRDIALVIMEIELSDINQHLDVPDYLRELIIYEITGIPQFSNSALALKQYL